MLSERFYYTLIDFFTILFPLLFSFMPLRKPFYKKWKFISIAILLPGFLFLIWDNLFTHWGVWNFNPRYILGIYWFHLPIEEVAWFICIPYACLFSYEAANHYIPKEVIGKRQTWISLVLVITLSLIAVFHLHRVYTSATFLGLALFITFVQWIWKPHFLGRFYLAFLFILVPFFIVNGILTGTGLEEAIVRYNNSENLSIRMGTIPIEDTFYGMLLLLMNVSLFEWLQKRKGTSD